MDARRRIGMLGGLSLMQPDGTLMQFRPQKTAGLLAYLAYYHDRTHPREELIELLWPEDDLETARHKLSVALSALRPKVEPAGVPDSSVLVADRSTVSLAPGSVITDVEAFEVAIRAAASHAEPDGDAGRIPLLEEALALYQGPLLPGYYEEWVQGEQRRLAELYLQGLRCLARLLEGAGQPERALDFARRALNANPLGEDAHQAVIRLLLATGRPGAAEQQYRELECLLERELGAVPAAATRALLHGGEGGFALRAGEAREPAPAPPPGDPAPREYPAGAAAPPCAAWLEPVGGAMPLASAFYVLRSTDREFEEAIARRDSIVLVKGARQVGKTSLLARGMRQARGAGMRVVLTDLQRLNARSLESCDTLLLTLAQELAEQLDLDVDLAESWSAHRGPNLNFTRFLRRVALADREEPVLWGLDEVDRLFTHAYGSEVFGLFRSWHNERALDPTGPWSRLTLAICYATEAHLFITDLNSSPFNVGTRLTLEDFTLEQAADLNRRYGSPLRDPDQLQRCSGLLGGHPYLLHRALHELATHPSVSIDAFAAQAACDEGIFGDHLRRLLSQLQRDPDLCEGVRRVLNGQPCPTSERFHRLRSAGVLVGESAAAARLRCQLYADYLAQHLG